MFRLLSRSFLGVWAWVVPQTDFALIEAALTARFKDKTVNMKVFPTSGVVRFTSDGKVVGKIQPGPWTLYATQFVDKVTVRPPVVRFEGKRVIHVWRDDSLHLSPLRSSFSRTVELQLRPDEWTPDGIGQALSNVFVGAEGMAPHVPASWGPFVQRAAGEEVPTTCKEFTDNVVTIDRLLGGKIEVIKKVPPFYPESARQLRLGGTVGLEVEVLDDGAVGDIFVVRAAGAGLDESALDAVQKWRFSPLPKDELPSRNLACISVNYSFRR